MNIIRTASLVSLTAIVAACAKNPQPETGAAAASGAAAAQSGAQAGSWSGNFTPRQSQTSAVAPTNSQRTYGRVTITPKGADLGHSRVHIEINTTENASVQTLAWGIYPGRCGSSSALAAPVIPPATLARIDLRNSAGTLETEVEVTMTRTQNYHINVFREQPSADASRVIACANLRPE